MFKLLMTVGIVLLIVASIVETIADIRGSAMPTFLPEPLAGLPSSHPATALGVPGAGLLLVGFVLEIALNALPGGRFIVGSIAMLAFLMTGGYIAGDG